MDKKKQWQKPTLTVFGKIEDFTQQRDGDKRSWCTETSASTTGRKYVGCGDAINAAVGS